jgi:hypothetical protein
VKPTARDAGACLAIVQQLASHASLSTTAQARSPARRGQAESGALLHVPYAPAQGVDKHW